MHNVENYIELWHKSLTLSGPALEALEDKSPKPDRLWDRIPEDIRERIAATRAGKVLMAAGVTITTAAAAGGELKKTRIPYRKVIQS